MYHSGAADLPPLPPIPDPGEFPPSPLPRCPKELGCLTVATLQHAADRPLGEQILDAQEGLRDKLREHSIPLPLSRAELQVQAFIAGLNLGVVYPCRRSCPLPRKPAV
jgi:hypothetical protein